MIILVFVEKKISALKLNAVPLDNYGTENWVSILLQASRKNILTLPTHKLSHAWQLNHILLCVHVASINWKLIIFINWLWHLDNIQFTKQKNLICRDEEWDGAFLGRPKGKLWALRNRWCIYMVRQYINSSH